jgi:hypothetical protein
MALIMPVKIGVKKTNHMWGDMLGDDEEYFDSG